MSQSQRISWETIGQVNGQTAVGRVGNQQAGLTLVKPVVELE